jgi:hypothetical protein
LGAAAHGSLSGGAALRQRKAGTRSWSEAMRLSPTLNAMMRTIEISEQISPYSMAVAPD